MSLCSTTGADSAAFAASVDLLGRVSKHLDIWGRRAAESGEGCGWAEVGVGERERGSDYSHVDFPRFDSKAALSLDMCSSFVHGSRNNPTFNTSVFVLRELLGLEWFGGPTWPTQASTEDTVPPLHPASRRHPIIHVDWRE